MFPDFLPDSDEDAFPPTPPDLNDPNDHFHAHRRHDEDIADLRRRLDEVETRLNEQELLLNALGDTQSGCMISLSNLVYLSCVSSSSDCLVSR